ncbi:MAG: hypothetical protein IJ524_01840 [Bacteroidales bacterium]|nr:hypothetical protein [Bacteroidales bacterium]
MKTNRDNLDLEQLLATLEHAGRDERRQQELGDMLDRLAAEQGERSEAGREHRHGAWWWTLRVAAAACILLFVSTVVRIWFVPTGEEPVTVAEADIPAAIGLELADSTTRLRDGDLRPAAPQRLTNALPTPYQRLTNSYHGGKTLGDEVAQQEAVSEIEETAPFEEVYFAEVEAVGEIPENTDTIPVIESDVEAESELVVQATPEPVQPEPVEPAAKPRERRRSFLGSLFRPAEPSLMEGTTLALLEF